MKQIIVFSGIDSAGKSTQIDILKKEFISKKTRYKIIWSRGGYTSLFEFMKKLVRLFFGKKLPKPGRNTERQEMFNKKSVSKLWYVLAMLDLIRLYAFTFRLYRFLGITIIADRYLWDTYVDFNISLGNINLSKSILWKIAVLLSPKPRKSILLYVSPEVSFQRSVDKNEPHFDELSVRENRIRYYESLIIEGKWKLVIDTEKESVKNTSQKIKEYIYGI
jgi:thymidylate kinase